MALAAAVAGCLFACASPPVHAQEVFRVTVERIPYQDAADPSLVIGRLSVNGSYIGNTYENCFYSMPEGTYPGRIRYVSKKGFVLGGNPRQWTTAGVNKLKHAGDFLLEMAVPGHENVLFHPGNKSLHVCGCVALGPASRDHTVPVWSALMSLRKQFYNLDKATGEPIESPDKNITIEIKGFQPECRRSTRLIVLSRPESPLSPGETMTCVLGLARTRDCCWVGAAEAGAKLTVPVKLRYRIKFKGDPKDFQPPEGDRQVGYNNGGHTGIQWYTLERDFDVTFTGDGQPVGEPCVRAGGFYTPGTVSLNLPSCAFGNVAFHAQFLGDSNLGPSNFCSNNTPVRKGGTFCGKQQ